MCEMNVQLSGKLKCSVGYDLDFACKNQTEICGELYQMFIIYGDPAGYDAKSVQVAFISFFFLNLHSHMRCVGEIFFLSVPLT